MSSVFLKKYELAFPDIRLDSRKSSSHEVLPQPEEQPVESMTAGKASLVTT